MKKEYNIFIGKNAEKCLRKIPKTFQDKIVSGILNLKEEAKPMGYKKLNSTENYYRIRVGNYRVVYEINEKERKINIFIIRHRKDAYFGM